ncbi:hypothetical protein CRUP_008679, partial [Coryphaenoides rupestris]
AMDTGTRIRATVNDHDENVQRFLRERLEKVLKPRKGDRQAGTQRQERSKRCGEEAQAAKTRQEFGQGDEFVSLRSRAAPGRPIDREENRIIKKR